MWFSVFSVRQHICPFLHYHVFGRLSYNKTTQCLIKRSTSSKAKEKKLDLSSYSQDKIRNFSIIAHVDHGKSTLADRLLEYTGAIIKSGSNQQVLDRLPVERERGITVKAQTAALRYTYKEENYLLNLIDTPGHVDFSHEVKRSLSACDAVILLVDANSGVQAQTVANFYLAFERDLTIIPVINKIDLPRANPESVKEELFTLFEIDPSSVIEISAKNGTNIEHLIMEVIKRTPSPKSASADGRDLPLRCLVIDSWFQKFRGTVPLVIVKDGMVCAGSKIESDHTGKKYEVREVGIFSPEPTIVDSLYVGQVGYLVSGMKSTEEVLVGDTFKASGVKNLEPLEKFTPAKPMVFAGLFPPSQDLHGDLKKSLDKLTLNDCSVSVTTDISSALGAGWRLGFLGLLHMDVFCQRLEQEYSANLVLTAPSVPYKVRIYGDKNIKDYGGEWITVYSVAKLPVSTMIVEYEELKIMGTLIIPERFLSPVLKLCVSRRGDVKEESSIGNDRLLVRCVLPLSEIVVGFYDKLKSITSGYSSFDYEEYGWHQADLVKLDVLLNGRIIEELGQLVHVTRARLRALEMSKLLASEIPRQQFLIKIQVAIGSKIVSKEEVKPYRKDVTQKLYGGDVTRKMKLLARQAEGKKRMRMVGNIEVPRETFINIMKQA